MDYITVNLPGNEESYKSGNGEGCWALADEKAKAAYDNNEKEGNYTVILDNDSLYYPGLMAGMSIPIEMRGIYRPVVPYQWLLDNYGGSINEIKRF